jgi:Family of unknown function (DUF6191)
MSADRVRTPVRLDWTDSAATGVEMFNLVEELFAPGRKHTEDERNRLELVRDEAGDGDPGKGPIDLDSGHVVIRPRDC